MVRGFVDIGLRDLDRSLTRHARGRRLSPPAFRYRLTELLALNGISFCRKAVNRGCIKACRLVPVKHLAFAAGIVAHLECVGAVIEVVATPAVIVVHGGWRRRITTVLDVLMRVGKLMMQFRAALTTSFLRIVAGRAFHRPLRVFFMLLPERVTLRDFVRSADPLRATGEKARAFVR